MPASVNFDRLCSPTQRSQLKLVKCNYDLKEQKRAVTEFADQLSRLISSDGHSIKDRNQALQFYTEHVSSQLKILANEIKHPAFEEEQEWRLVKTFVHANHPNLKYRPGKGMLIPYYEISLVESDTFPPISEIYIGPHKNAELSERVTRTFLAGERANYPESPFVYVKRSEAPYREI